MWLRLSVLSLSLICVCYTAADSNPYDTFLPGSPQRCVTVNGTRIPVFEVLAGGGWDNLRNRDMAMLMELNYSKCRTTDDGRYLIPDNLYTIPIKSSKVDTYAEMFEHWNNYTSTTSSSINMHAGLNYDGVKISGKFSHGFEQVKSHQYFDKAVTTRVQVRYARYLAKLVPGSPLSAEFRRRLRSIGAHVRLNRTDSARYESQIVVRDFGTHVITSLDAGATLSQVDHLQTSIVETDESQKSTILALASASFFKVFNFSMGYSDSTGTVTMDTYEKARTSSEVKTYGGPIFQPKSYTGNDWSKSLSDDLVAIDRSGDPLYYLINKQTLPELPMSTVALIRSYVKEAVDLYYKHNAYRGCTRPESPNFSFQANVDDGTCEPSNVNLTFGGVYQTCQSSGYTDLCENMQHKNPLTKYYTCPLHFEPVTIQTGYKSASTTQTKCERCWLFFHCCDDNTLTASAQYSAYWCSASSSVNGDSGFLFGGLYTNTVANRVTGSFTCPKEFYPLRILDDLYVCVSDDIELGALYALPFAGFFSCISGNPLAVDQNAGLSKSGKPSKLKAFMMESGESQYPKKCPEGYSQHLAVNDRGCEVHYCVKSGAFTNQGLPEVNIPPFMNMPSDEPEIMLTKMVFSDDGAMWSTMFQANDSVLQYLQSKGLPPPNDVVKNGESTVTGNEDGGGSGSSSGGLHDGLVAVISTMTTLACAALVVLVVKVVGRRRRHYRTENVTEAK